MSIRVNTQVVENSPGDASNTGADLRGTTTSPKVPALPQEQSTRYGQQPAALRDSPIRVRV